MTDMRLRSIVSRVLGSTSASQKGRRATRRVCVGDITDDAIWFEVCDPDAGDFRHQYGVPKRHYTYSREELTQLDGFEIDDRGVYAVTLESWNEQGTLWVFRDADRVAELPPGYQKNRLGI